MEDNNENSLQTNEKYVEAVAETSETTLQEVTADASTDAVVQGNGFSDTMVATPKKEPFLDNKRKYLLIVLCLSAVVLILGSIQNYYNYYHSYLLRYRGYYEIEYPVWFDSIYMQIIVLLFNLGAPIMLAYYLRRGKTMRLFYILLTIRVASNPIIILVQMMIKTTNGIIFFYQAMQVIQWVFLLIGDVLILLNVFKKNGMLYKQMWVIAYTVIALINTFILQLILRMDKGYILATIITALLSTQSIAMVLYWFLKKDSDIPQNTFGDIVDKGMNDDGLPTIDEI